MELEIRGVRPAIWERHASPAGLHLKHVEVRVKRDRCLARHFRVPAWNVSVTESHVIAQMRSSVERNNEWWTSLIAPVYPTLSKFPWKDHFFSNFSDSNNGRVKAMLSISFQPAQECLQTCPAAYKTLYR